MTVARSYTLARLASEIDVRLQGDADCVVTGVGTLKSAKPGQITFLNQSAYRRYLPQTQAAAVILAEQDAPHCHTNALIAANPYYAYARVAKLFDCKPEQALGVHPTVVIGADCEIDSSVRVGAGAVIGNGVRIGADTVIGPGCVIGDACRIGSQCVLEANVTLYHRADLGSRVIVHSGTVIGSDGFGFAKEAGAWHKIAQLGTVIIEDDVEIGANTTVDRGTIDDTVIRRGVKLDNQIQIAHNVEIGEHTIIAAKTGVSGSVKIGKHCLIGGAVAISGHVEIVDRVVLTGTAAVSNSVKTAGTYSAGTGIMPNLEWRKNIARLRHLDRIVRKLSCISGGGEKKRAPDLQTVNVKTVLNNLPQRFPFLLVDRIIEFKPGKYLRAIKNVTMNEAYFQGHFPGHPIMPGVLIIEALAQACTVYAFLTRQEDPQTAAPYYFAGLDKARFRRPVEPGDQLALYVEFIKKRKNVFIMRGEARVDDEVVCNVELTSVQPQPETKA